MLESTKVKTSRIFLGGKLLFPSLSLKAQCQGHPSPHLQAGLQRRNSSREEIKTGSKTPRGVFPAQGTALGCPRSWIYPYPALKEGKVPKSSHQQVTVFYLQTQRLSLLMSLCSSHILDSFSISWNVFVTMCDAGPGSGGGRKRFPQLD